MHAGLLTAFLIVFGVNLLPAFGPPSWSLLVFFRLNWDLNPVALVLVGVLAASLGRFLLATAARRSRRLFPEKYIERLQGASDLLSSHRRGSLAAFGLFIISPLPSAQLFLAAGLLEMPLVPLTLAFAIGRTVSYSLYVGVATLAERSLGDAFSNFFGSWWSILLQLALLVGVTLLPLVDWKGIAERRRAATA